MDAACGIFLAALARSGTAYVRHMHPVIFLAMLTLLSDAKSVVFTPPVSIHYPNGL